jgi:transcriptional regulator with XRE-family HTH domain
MPVDPALGPWIRSSRTAARLTLEQVGEAAGVHASCVQGLEVRGKALSEAVLRRIASKLGLDGDEVVVRAGIVPGDVAAWITAEHTRIRAVRELMAARGVGP